MTQHTGADAVRRTLTVPASPDRAFAVFTAKLASWWPPEYTWAGDVLDAIAIEPREGGRCFERGPHGFECDWGRVLVWDPPGRLVFTWQISPTRVPEPDPAKASEIEVRFAAEGSATTRVAFDHRGFERHGESGAGYRDALDSPQGWTYILDRYASAVS
jgi:uncharacterized protein YndB with AHSA1/START domain